jgi:N-acetylglucosamine-6-sulfatase
LSLELSRRRFLELAAAGLAGAGLAGCPDEPDPPEEPDPPLVPARNLVIFMSDDHRADLIAHQGHPVLRTPNLDRLAAEGISASRLFSVAMDCQPSRVSLFSSLYARSHGIINNTMPVPASITFLTEVLKEAGFVTGGFGKLHQREGAAQGFDEIGPATWHDAYRPSNIAWDDRAIESGRSLLALERAPTRIIAEQGMAFIRKNAARRFCTVISTPDPHPPYIAPEPFYSRIDPASVPVLSFRESTQFWRDKPEHVVSWYAERWARVTRGGMQRVLATYFAQIELIDHELGRVLELLRTLGIEDETLVLYVSDHGDMGGAGGVMGKSLGLMYDPVIRQPFVARHASLGTGGRKLDALLESVDVAPTLLRLLDVPAPGSFQGRDAHRVLRGRDVGRQDVISTHPFAESRAVRTARHKLLIYGIGHEELYDLQVDPQETQNLIATADAALVADLRMRLLRAG